MVKPKLCKCGCGNYTKPGNDYINGHQNRGKEYWQRQQEPKLCECGCGDYAEPGNDYIKGHQKRGKPYWDKQKAPQLCECGCGNYAKPGNRFIKGHENRNLSDERKKRLKDVRDEYWSHQENHDDASERWTEYWSHQENKDAQSERKIEHFSHQENRDAASERTTNYHKDHPEAAEEMSDLKKQYYIDHTEVCEEMSKIKIQYYIDHPEAREEASRKTIEQFSTQEARDNHREIALKYNEVRPEKGEEHSSWLIQYHKDNPEVIKNLHKESYEYWLHQENKDAQAVRTTKHFEDPINREKMSAIKQGIIYEEWDHFTWEETDWRDWHKAIYLNDYFKGCHRHHITKTIVIHIPAELHLHIGHNLKTGRGMAEMNMLALQFINGGL